MYIVKTGYYTINNFDKKNKHLFIFILRVKNNIKINIISINRWCNNIHTSIKTLSFSMNVRLTFIDHSWIERNWTHATNLCQNSSHETWMVYTIISLRYKDWKLDLWQCSVLFRKLKRCHTFAWLITTIDK